MAVLVGIPAVNDHRTSTLVIPDVVRVPPARITPIMKRRLPCILEVPPIP